MLLFFFVQGCVANTLDLHRKIFFEICKKVLAFCFRVVYPMNISKARALKLKNLSEVSDYDNNI